GVGAADTEGVGDVLAVAPDFFQTSGRERERAHRGAEPGNAGAAVEWAERGEHGSAALAPPREQLRRGAAPPRVVLALLALGMVDLELAPPRVRVDHSQARGDVRIREVGDLVPHGPAFGRGGRVPARGLEAGDEHVERFVLGLEVVADPAHGYF